jgi:hypothetical protein
MKFANQILPWILIFPPWVLYVPLILSMLSWPVSRYYPSTYLEGLRETTRNLSHNIRRLNARSSESELRIPIAHRFVWTSVVCFPPLYLPSMDCQPCRANKLSNKVHALVTSAGETAEVTRDIVIICIPNIHLRIKKEWFSNISKTLCICYIVGSHLTQGCPSFLWALVMCTSLMPVEQFRVLCDIM